MSINIAEKKYRKLFIQISTNELSFYSLDTLNNIPSVVSDVLFFEQTDFKLEDKINDFLSINSISKNEYDSVLIIHDNELFSAVPSSLFDKNNKEDYLKFSTKTFNTDQFLDDIIENHGVNIVFIPNLKIANLLNNTFEKIENKHATSILTKQLLDLSKNSYDLQFYVHVQNNHFEIVVIDKGKLQLLNSFQYRTKEDFIYYVLFTIEQLKLNPETVQLQFLGDINTENELYQITYKYIRNVSLLSDLQANSKNYTIDIATCLKHFILLHA